VTSRGRVLIADDHPAVRRGVRLALERSGYDVVAECADSPSAVDEAARVRPDICLLDIRMPGGGIEAAAAIRAMVSGTQIVMLTVSADSRDLFAALCAGASGYILKGTEAKALPLALQGVLHGETVVPQGVARRMMEEFRRREYEAHVAELERAGLGLTSREWDVLNLLAHGYSTAEIGTRLSITAVTVRSHVAAIMKKLHVGDRSAAVRVFREAERPAVRDENLNGSA